MQRRRTKSRKAPARTAKRGARTPRPAAGRTSEPLPFIDDLKGRRWSCTDETNMFSGPRPESILGGLNSFYLLVDKPEVYGLPAAPKLPSKNLVLSSIFSVIGAAAVGILGLLSLRTRKKDAVRQGGPK